MASVVIKGNSSGSGSVTIEAPNTNSTPTFILPSADGTNGQVLQTNGSGTLSFTTGGAFAFLSTVDISNAATVDFTLPSGYDAYLFVCGNILSADPVNSVIFQLRTSSNGGSTYDSGASDYRRLANLASQVNISGSIGPSSLGGYSGNVTLFFPALAKPTYIAVDGASQISTSLALTDTFSQRDSSAAVDAVRFFMSADNIASGSITLYGMKNA